MDFVLKSTLSRGNKHVYMSGWVSMQMSLGSPGLGQEVVRADF